MPVQPSSKIRRASPTKRPTTISRLLILVCVISVHTATKINANSIRYLTFNASPHFNCKPDYSKQIFPCKPGFQTFPFFVKILQKFCRSDCKKEPNPSNSKASACQKSKRVNPHHQSNSCPCKHPINQ